MDPWSIVYAAGLFGLGMGVGHLIDYLRHPTPDRSPWDRQVRDLDEARWRDSLVPFRHGRRPY
jgi:hypothetical protein